MAVTIVSIMLGVELGHGRFGEVAAVVNEPLVVGAGHDDSDVADYGDLVGAPISSSGRADLSAWSGGAVDSEYAIHDVRQVP